MTPPQPQDRTRVIVYGLGGIGSGVARVLLDRPDYEIVGAIDIQPGKAGCDLGRLIGLRQDLGLTVSSDEEEILSLSADVVVHATSSSLEQVMPELQAIIRTHHNVVSTCEELAEPRAQHRFLGDSLNSLAKRHRVSVLGTGVNPGFAMDTWPLTLTAACEQVSRVRVRRVVDASRRRIQLQKKIGTGLSAAAFAEGVARGELRHVGLKESVSLLARGLGWELDHIDEKVEPVLAKRRIMTDFFTVDSGFVSGVSQVARGVKNKVERIRLELHMTVDTRQCSDEVWIEGRPNLHSQIEGIHGDVGTAALVANACRRIVDAPTGLLTMIDLPVIGGYGE